MILLLLVGCALVASARAVCDACVEGWCHSRKTLVEGFHITDQLALDHTHNILYVQLNSNLNSAFFLDDLKIKMIQFLNTSGMTVDQDTQDLYIAGYNHTIYKFEYGNEIPEIISVDTLVQDVNLIFAKYRKLFYTSRFTKHLSFLNLEDKISNKYYTSTENISMTDFVVKDNKVYFVADSKVYVIIPEPIKLIYEENCVLSTDKFDNVYLGDANLKVIYKLDEEDELNVYAVYRTGSVDKFVFDRDNNIVFHDADDGNIVTWKKESIKCKIHAPHTDYIIGDLLPELEDVNDDGNQ